MQSEPNGAEQVLKDLSGKEIHSLYEKPKVHCSDKTNTPPHHSNGLNLM
jgi:hypothetical protein